MGKIQLMSEDLANKIAAGEVVEKTMNVVKELVENSIDAKSKSIKIELKDSGVKEIIVTDDGIGMDKDDAILSFSRHATSKLKSFDDLFYIDSLGFRGEALPSIASVSTVILKTCNGVNGTEVIIDGGVTKSVKASDLKQGTKITVKDLFYNTPVRLKYIKNLYSELANVIDYINKMSLSFPNIKFTLINNDKIILNTDGSNNLLKVIGNIYGIDIAKKMIKLDYSNDDYHLHGYISYPEMARSNKNNITILVNGRVIKNSYISKKVLEGYHTYIPDDKYPVVVLNIEVDPILIDVNIHPTKMDIKISKIDTLNDLILSSISTLLSTINLIPEIKEIKEKDIYNMPTLYRNNIDDIKDINTVLDLEEERKNSNDYPNIEDITFDFSVREQDPLTGEERIKKMYPVGVVHATYIIAENEDGMFMIDQHAAAERINYEKYLEKMANHDNQRIDLLVPIKIELPSNEYIILKENINILEELGIGIEEFGINTILIRNHPYWLVETRVDDAIRKIIDIIITNESFDSKRFTENVAITLACKLSIKANDHITLTDMEDLLDRLRMTKNPFTCPHGRPTIITYSKYDLEKLFKRAMN